MSFFGKLYIENYSCVTIGVNWTDDVTMIQLYWHAEKVKKKGQKINIIAICCWRTQPFPEYIQEMPKKLIKYVVYYNLASFISKLSGRNLVC